jgi:hypothetical protein
MFLSEGATVKKILRVCAEKAGEDGELKLSSDAGEREKVLAYE